MTGINPNTSSTTAGRDAEGGKTGWPNPATSSSLVTKGKEGGRRGRQFANPPPLSPKKATMMKREMLT